MTREQRQITDEPVDASAHQPTRPGWHCEAGCGDWPCEIYRDWIWASCRDQFERATFMAGFFNMAVAELPAPETPGDIHRRFLGWTREAATAVPLRGRPPGGIF